MAEGEIDRRILDLLRSNGKSTALSAIVKHLGESKKTVNKHLYSLEESKLLKKINGSPPIWDLMERTDDPTPAVNPDIEFKEEKLSEILKSGGKTGLKAHEIARDMRQDRKTVNKHLYSLKDEGKAQISDNNKWIYTENLQQDSQPSVDPKASDSGLSQCLDVIDILGEGGYGCVYKVQHKIDGKMYAVKKVVMTNEADTEVKALAKLEHPNIVRYITCWSSSQDWTSCQDASDQSDPSIDIVFEGSSNEASDALVSGVETLSLSSESESSAKPSEDHTGLDHSNHSRVYLFIKMEFCEGGTLTAWINERNMNKKQRNTTEIHQIFHEIVSGVEYVHSQNLIHRDLKPDNILFGAEGKVKIGDFGLVATLTNPNGSAVSRTKGRGTKSYMSPEQELQSNYDAKTDIFPLGLIWFEMLWVLSTGMERVELWPDLRNQTFPEGFCDQYRTEHKFIRMMLSHAPRGRPQAKDIKEKLDTFFSMDQNLRQKTT